MKLKTRGEKIFIYVNLILLIIFSLTIILPILNIVALSFSSNAFIKSGAVSFIPKGFTLDSYNYLLQDSGIFQAFKISVIVTVVGTIFSMLITIFVSYPLSKPNLKYRKGILLFFVFTMMFSGGLVPSFILMNGLGLLNTIWVLILPGMFSAYNMLLVKNYMEGIPESLEESARIDGASDFVVFKKIILPLSKPVLATVGLFTAVGYWNSYFGGIMYITDPNLKPLQTKLYELVQASTLIWQLSAEQQQQLANISSSGIQSATILVATIPILCVYPFLQKHFVKGIVVGSEK
ncbi:MAG: carbohydrate ABC transporter permease [Mycoplasmatales bacterium]